MASMSRWPSPPPGVDGHEWESANRLVAQQSPEPLGYNQIWYLVELLADPDCDEMSDEELVEEAAAVSEDMHREWRELSAQRERHR